MSLIYGRDTEEPSRLAFTKWLHDVGCNQIIAWDKVQKDPPDYFLTIGGNRIAVEVTSLVDAFGGSDPGRTHPAIFIDLQRFRCFLEAGLKEIAPLDVSWEVLLYDVPERKRWGEVRESIFRTIRDSREGANCLRFPFKYGVIHVREYLEPGLEVNPAFGTWPKSEALEILKRSLASKAEKMAKHRVAKPWLLLWWCSGLLVQKRHYLRMFETWY